MRSIWIIISTLAIANLLGIAGFVGWLAATDRLGGGRVGRIRELLVKTVAQEKAEQAEAEAVAKTNQAKAEQDAKMKIPPEGSSEAISRVRDQDDLMAARLARTREELKQLQQQLDARQAALERDKAALADAQKRLDAKLAEAATTMGSEQFKQALAALEAQKPAEARKVLQSLIDLKQTDQAVQYLAAMSERGRSRIIGEFIKSDQKLAAQLLEQLRTRGLEPATPPTQPATAGSGS